MQNPLKFQFVPSRGGQPVCLMFVIIQKVSIRALTRRATDPVIWKSLELEVSIRALTRRATFFILTSLLLLLVSIRALTRRATKGVHCQPFCIEFQFVPSRGGQPTRANFNARIQEFQFVPSRGGQPERIVQRQAENGFNSCPHAEGNPRNCG